MKLKLDENGNVVVQDGKPVYVYEDGKEVAFDAPQTVSTISRLNGEAKTNRERYESAESTLKSFSGIDDPSAALKAMQTVKNLNDKQLVDAGEVEKVKLEAMKAMEEKYAPVVQERDQFQAQLHGELIGGGFARSKYIQDNLTIPVDMAQAMFGKNFKIEDGKVVAVGSSGQQIFSKSRPGELADMDEAIESLVGEYQHRDSILKGSQAGGGGFQGGGAKASAHKSLSDCKTEDEKIAYLKQVATQ